MLAYFIYMYIDIPMNRHLTGSHYFLGNKLQWESIIYRPYTWVPPFPTLTLRKPCDPLSGMTSFDRMMSPGYGPIKAEGFVMVVSSLDLRNQLRLPASPS